jgi:hypothetical protein
MSVVSVNVPETPVAVPIVDRGGASKQWTKWFSSIGTWISNGSVTTELTLSHGTAYATRVGNTVVINAVLNAGTYSSTIVSGMDVIPAIETIATLQGSAPGTAKILTDGTISVTIVSTTDILMTASVVVGKEI